MTHNWIFLSTKLKKSNSNRQQAPSPVSRLLKMRNATIHNPPSFTMHLIRQDYAKSCFSNLASSLGCRHRRLRGSLLSRSLQHQQTKLRYSNDTKISSSSSSSSSSSPSSCYRPPIYTSHSKELMSIPKEQYVPPPLPFETSVMSSPSFSSEDAETSFFPSQDFMLPKNNDGNDNEKLVFFNHGSYGAALKCGYDRAQEWRYYLEKNPCRYFDRDLMPHLIHSNRRMVDFVNANTTSHPEEEQQGMTLLQNSTTAFNAIIAGYVREYPNGKIISWDETYNNTKNMIHHHYHSSLPPSSLSSSTTANGIIEIPFQSEYLHRLSTRQENAADVFIEALDHELSKHPRHYWEKSLLVLDHITSDTAIHVPIEAIAKHAKDQWGMLVAVDGAHGLLSQNLDMEQLSPVVDFYVSNGHKWLSCPRGVAMMYCPHDELRETVLRYPPVVSHGINDGYVSRFLWDGCRDYASELSLPVVLDYWNQIDGGPQGVRAHLRTKLTKGVEVLARLWHDENYCGNDSDTNIDITLVPLGLHPPTMAMVRLPELREDPLQIPTNTDAKHIQELLYRENIEVPIKCINGVLYARVSCHLYNTMDDFERFGHAIQKIYKLE